jgi:hypothetical protein
VIEASDAIAGVAAAVAETDLEILRLGYSSMTPPMTRVAKVAARSTRLPMVFGRW